MSSKLFGIGNFCFGRVCGDHNASGGQASKPQPPRGRAALLTDTQILEVRALNQFASGWGRAALAKRYGVKADMIDRVLSGITRSRLVATRKHLPADVEAA